MGLFKDVVNNIKQIVSEDEDSNYFDSDYEDKDSKKEKMKFKLPSFTTSKTENKQLDFNLTNLDYSSKQKPLMPLRPNNSHIEVFCPKSFEEGFAIINEVKNGTTAMVNVETCNQPTLQRIIDLISGAIYALDGKCKRIGEKQYLYSLTAEMIGASDYLPTSNKSVSQNQYMNNQGNSSFPFSFTNFGQQNNNLNPNQGFNQNQVVNQNQGYNPNQGFNQNQSYNPNQGFNQNQFANQNQGFNQNQSSNSDFFNNKTVNDSQNQFQSGSVNPNDFYIPPQSQF